MRKALVLGASGGMGYSIVKELASRDIEVTAFARNHEKLARMFGNDSNVSLHPGDIFDQEVLHAAASNVDVIYNAVNIPYGEWEDKLLHLNNCVIDAAKANGAKLAVVDNIYAFGRRQGTPVNEDTPKKAHTKKGKLRVKMEDLIKDSGVSYLITHFPDFYGPNVENGQINYTLRQILADKKAGFIGKHSVKREHIYTPDGAKAIVELSLHDEAFGQCWTIPGAGVIAGEEIIQIIRSITRYDKRVSTITKNMIRSLGIFNKQMREFAEMQYLNEDPVILDGGKYENIVGPVPKTPYREGLKETVDSYNRNS